MTLTQRIQQIQQYIHDTALACGRPPDSIQLLAVSKGRSIEQIQQALRAGLHAFGESYLQESLEKIRALSAEPITWHFIGPIQKNKTRGIAQAFSWVHSVCRIDIAQRLNEQRPDTLPPLNVCLQVNFDGEETKSGVAPEHVAALASEIIKLPRLHLRGLMMIPKPCTDENQQYHSFLRLSRLQSQLNETLMLKLDTLSMGMSDDIKPAIFAGSTLVRVGRALFSETTT
jgi:pyridoxal phosphate enzyme (YggS family)